MEIVLSKKFCDNNLNFVQRFYVALSGLDALAAVIAGLKSCAVDGGLSGLQFTCSFNFIGNFRAVYHDKFLCLGQLMSEFPYKKAY